MAKKRLPAAVSEEEPKKSATASENQNQQDAVQEEEQPLWVKMARAARENGHGKATSVLQGMSDRGELTDSDRKQVRDYALKKQVRRGTPDSGENGTISKIAGPISYEDLSAQADRELEEYQQTGYTNGYETVDLKLVTAGDARKILAEQQKEQEEK